MIHYYPDKDFIIKKFLYSANQIRMEDYKRSTKRVKFHSLFHSSMIQDKCKLYANDLSSMNSSFTDSEENDENRDENNLNQAENLEVINEFPEKEENEIRKTSEDKSSQPRFSQTNAVQTLVKRSSSESKLLARNSIKTENEGPKNILSSGENNMILLDPLNILSMKKDFSRKKSAVLQGMTSKIQERRSQQVLIVINGLKFFLDGKI